VWRRSAARTGQGRGGGAPRSWQTLDGEHRWSNAGFSEARVERGKGEKERTAAKNTEWEGALSSSFTEQGASSGKMLVRVEVVVFRVERERAVDFDRPVLAPGKRAGAQSDNRGIRRTDEQGERIYLRNFLR